MTPVGIDMHMHPPQYDSCIWSAHADTPPPAAPVKAPLTSTLFPRSNAKCPQ